MPFIVFEGLDGSGKSTLIKEFVSNLDTLGIRSVNTREPGGTPLGDAIRKLLLEKGPTEPLPRAELLLYEAARAQHVDEFIRPHLKRGTWVICDRYTASSIAFQSGGRGIDREQVEALNNFATEGLTADLTVFLNVSLAVAEGRRSSREQLDRFELEKQEFHAKVRENFLAQAARDEDRWLILEGDQATAQQLAKNLMNHLRERKWL